MFSSTVLFFLRKFTKLIKKRFARVPQVFVIAPGVKFINKQDGHDVIKMIKVQKCTVIDMEKNC
jgi:hypothetical protein